MCTWNTANPQTSHAQQLALLSVCDIQLRLGAVELALLVNNMDAFSFSSEWRSTPRMVCRMVTSYRREHACEVHISIYVSSYIHDTYYWEL